MLFDFSFDHFILRAKPDGVPLRSFLQQYSFVQTWPWLRKKVRVCVRACVSER